MTRATVRVEIPGDEDIVLEVDVQKGDEPVVIEFTDTDVKIKTNTEPKVVTT